MRRNNCKVGKLCIGSVSVLQNMRNAMIVYSFVPIVFMAANFVVYMSFQSIESERYAKYLMTALSGLMLIYTIGLLFKKKLMLGILAKSGLVLTAVSFLIGGVLWNFQLSPSYVLLAISFYIMGQVAFVIGAWISLSVKLSHILFYVFLIASYLIKDFYLQSSVAIVAMSIVAYPMLVSYLAVDWASKEFFNLDR